MKIKTFYNKNYYANTSMASMRKLPHIALEVEKLGIGQLIDPFEVYKGSIIESLSKLHHPNYVRQFISGKGKLASSQGFEWTKQIRDGVLAINAGQLAGAKTALEDGIAANIAQGFHHSQYERGGGFCTFNGLALVAQENPKLKIMVIDTDEHQGNGTMEFLDRHPNLYNFTIYGSDFGGTVSEQSRRRNRAVDFGGHPVTENFDSYLEAMHDAFGMALEMWRPDLIIYQAGADPHIDDPLGTLGITTKQMKERDTLMFEFTRDFGIPILFVMAGGYQEPLYKTVKLHVNTFIAANEIYNGDKNPAQWTLEPSEYLATLK